MIDFTTATKEEIAKCYTESENLTTEELALFYVMNKRVDGTTELVPDLELEETFASENGLIEDEQELSTRYDDLLAECETDLYHNGSFDSCAFNEGYNNFKDSEHRDGNIGEAQCHSYCYVGKWESEL